MTEKKLSQKSRVFFIINGILLIIFITYKNIEPFGITLHYSTKQNKGYLTKFNPANRFEKIIENGNQVIKQIDDVIYFSVKFPKRIQSGKVKIRFKNPNPEQDIYIGFQESDKWHYSKKIFEDPMLNDMNWYISDSDPILIQRNRKFTSVDNFLNNLPKDSLIGSYKFDKNLLLKNIKIPEYSAKSEMRDFNIILRGKHVLFTYLENEPFIMDFVFQDLNWYEGPDVVNIRIYKDKEEVYNFVLDDDGIIDSSGKTENARIAHIQNPGPGLPESGVYKVIIDAESDILLKSIRTNLHKLVFESPLFLAGNHSVYPNVIHATIPTRLLSNSPVISASTFHDDGLQKITVGDEYLELTKTKEVNILTPKKNINLIDIPTNDVILNGFGGYFALNTDSFFEPNLINLVNLTNSNDLNLVDYIITSYKPSIKVGDWREAEIDFDLSNAVPQNDMLSWMIHAPYLKENNRNFIIESIVLDLYKNPLFK